jgi:hypothetical protein
MATNRASPGHTALAALLAPIPPAPDGLLAQRKLLKRTDSKFVFPARELEAILPRLADAYRILPVGDDDVARYQTLYFDTPELRCFHDHRRGRRPRHKIRIRRYPDRSLSFLEVKTRRSELLSVKQRLELPYETERLGAEERAFVAAHCGLPVDGLAPEVWVDFCRVTLLGERTEERLTLDVELGVRRDGAAERLGGIAILEVKQASLSRGTAVMQALRARRLRAGSLSKYCTAVALTRDGVRRNRFLPSLRAIERMKS